MNFFRFSHVYSSALWGGESIRSRYGRGDAPSPCAESWEVSAHPAGMSVVAGGPFDGTPLDSLASELGARLVGTAAPKGRFPLLLKIIDAARPLSVQVHPNERTASISGGDPKSEAWYVVSAVPGASLYAGLRPGVDATMVREAAQAGASVAGLLAEHRVSQGDFIYIPGGTPHAIGGGIMIYEVQQSSDTTFRLYDWGRTDSAGKPRTLHVDAAVKAAEYGVPPPTVVRGRVTTPFFDIREIRLDGPMEIVPDGTTFHAVFTVSGNLSVARAGESILIPATGERVVLEPVSATAKILLVSLA